MHIIARLRKLFDEYDERLIIAEIYLPVKQLVAYYGVTEKEAHLPFNFMLIALPWESQTIGAAIDEYEGALPEEAWPNWVMGNHDQPRIPSRIGEQQAKVAQAVLLLTLRGTPTIYYGEEIGKRMQAGCAHSPGRDPGPARPEHAGQEPQPRPRTHTHAVGQQRKCRIYRWKALAAVRPDFSARECAIGATRSIFYPHLI